jgi:CheY-like chemotaxis protein
MQNKKNIFLVEDDADDQYFFTEALREIEHANLFAIADNGQDALDKLKNSMLLPDVIFTDINMPKLSGIGFLRALLKTSRIKNIPVVVLSTD